MAFGTNGFDAEEEVMSEINMTPLVDVMLVLLIIFMVTMPVLTHSVRIELPQAASQPEQNPSPPINLTIDAGGNYRWNDESVTQAALQARLTQVGQQAAPPALRISADKSARFEPVAQALAAAQQAGLRQVGVVTKP